jgi:hypothetical protein
MKEYFSHEYNARDDDKMPKLLSEVGYEGYGIFWAVVEMLYKNEGFMQLDSKSIAFALHCDCICLDRVLNEFDLFIIEDGKFHSESVLRRLGIRKDISEKRRNAAKSRVYTNDEQKQNKSITKGPNIKEKESKEKDIKVKENKEIIMPFVSDIFVNVWEDWKTYKKKEHKFNYKSSISEQASLNELKEISGNNEHIALKIINQSIANGWQGFFKLNKNKESEKPAQPRNYMSEYEPVN